MGSGEKVFLFQFTFCVPSAQAHRLEQFEWSLKDTGFCPYARQNRWGLERLSPERDRARYSCLIMTHQEVSPRRVAVFCGSAVGNDPAFLAEARALGRMIAAKGLGLVYGGTCVGLMGAVADAALADGADVVGVLPDVLQGREIAHRGLKTLEMVNTMHERKARMYELAVAFIALPGGYGTLDELLETITWAQLNLHAKPCILINTAHYWDGLLGLLDSAVAAGFVKPENRSLVLVAANAAEAVEMAAGAIG
jgi:hypothetical protein